MKKKVVLYIDMPWNFATRKTGTKFGGGVTDKYPTMKPKEIKEFFKKLGEVVKADNAVGFFWCTHSHTKLLFECFSIMESYGWRFTSLGFNWVKINKDGSPFKGPGAVTGCGSELCWVITKGSMPPHEKLVAETLLAPRGKHSEKPEEIRLRIQRMYPLDKTQYDHVELFGRNAAIPGWRIFGNAINGKDIFDEMDTMF